jgi:hypothetical protein
MGYVSDENLFVFSHPPTGLPMASLDLADSKGNPAGSLQFTWPDEFAGTNPYAEGIAWIPSGEPRYGGCFVLAAIQQNGFENSFLVVNRLGEVVAKITPNIDQTFVNFYPTGLAYHDGHLFVGDLASDLYEFDLDGNIVAGPLHFSDAYDLEGVTFAERSNRVVVTSGANGKLIFLDASLERQPEERSFLAGFGLSNARDVTWSNSTSEFLVNAVNIEPSLNLPQIAAISSDLSTSREILSLGNFSTSPLHFEYLPDSDELAITRRTPLPRGYLFYNLNGTQTAFSAVPSATLLPNTFTYIPGTQQFAVRRTAPATTIFIYNRANLAGAPVRSIDLAPLGITSVLDITYMHPEDPSGGQFLITNLANLYVVDLNGALLAQYPNTLHVGGVGALTSGPYAGNFAGIYVQNNDFIIFSLP